ncbi:MAG: hypothetical protein ACLP0J_01985 [Solirubrobacteraceae bacterium]
MSEHQAARTLVKSAPELWEACSEESSLARHLKSFGEIRITRLEPETAVAWEGERTSGTVRLEPSGWGTRVTLTARALEAPDGEIPFEPKGEPQVDVESEDQPQVDVKPEVEAFVPTPEPLRPRFFQRLFARRRARARPAPVAVVVAEPMAVVEPEPVVEAEPAAVAVSDPPVEPRAEFDPVASAEFDPETALTEALDSLGRAHHRPFSRG